ncbi:Inactive histone-lysine N-methyltransferase 2E [Schistosoma japonicum]|nr:Inactive histone-lysine N-methyltransferase 2E [Schistosoma japonicum]
MLGLVSHVNLMDALIHPHRQVNNFNYFTLSRRSCSRNSASESDAIIEDTPDSPVEITDYSSQPPDIGRTVIINHDGCEISLCDAQKGNRRVVCFLHQNPECDPDEYPFHAVTYGESEGCWGLPYNDHNYASYESNPCHTGPPESDDRLSLLAKLALAKDDSTEKLGEKVSSTLQSTLQSNWINKENSTVASATKSLGLIELNPLNTSNKRVSSNSEHFSTPTYGQSLVTMASHVPPMSSRTILLSTTSGNVNPPLQIHRVSSSLTPHVVLRTGLPGLQISTTAARQVTTESGEPVRCICGDTNVDGYLVQCNQCRIWHHSECISSASKSHLSTPYVCELCQTHPKAITIQRPHLTTFSSVGSTTNSSIRISRTSIATNTPPGRIFLNAFGGATPRHVHVCIPPNQGVSGVQCGEFSLVSGMSSTENSSVAAHPSNRSPCGRSVRSSKRKQNLLTLTGGSCSANSGIEGFSSSSPVLDDFEDLSNIRPSYTSDSKSCFVESSLDSAYQTQGSYSTLASDNKTQIRHNSIVHRLIADCTSSKVQSSYTQVNEVYHTSPPCSTSDSILSPSSDVYEEAQTLHLSSRLCKKLDLMFPLLTGMTADFGDTDGISNEEIPSNLESLLRYQVFSFDFNRRGLIANEDICPRTPIIEYRGNCLLLSEYSDMYDYRKHYNPFVLFYKSLPKLPICVDARKYGNEARYIRRSCTPNSEVRHCISFSNDSHNGPVPHLRLVVVASRLIPKSSEITLPFDFDYTACRYLVKCACILKGCPVTRWFQRMNQLSNPLRSSTRHSLVCTRKLPHSPRSYGINGYSRGLSLSHNSQLNYDEKDADEQSTVCSKSPINNNVKNFNVSRTSRHLISNERTSVLNQTTSSLSVRGFLKNTGISYGVRKTSHRRGRGRGRLRSSSLGVHTKRGTKRVSSKMMCRSKLNSKRPLKTTRKRRSQRTASYFHSNQHPTKSPDNNMNVERKTDVRDFSSKNGCSYDAERINGMRSVPVKTSDDFSLKSPNIYNQEVTDNKDVDSKLRNELLEDDLDADTEPEYDVQPEKFTDKSVCQKYTRPNLRQDCGISKVTVDANSHSKSPDIGNVKVEAHEDNSSKRKSVDLPLIDRGKRRSQINSGNHVSISHKRSNSQEGKDDKKSKEDVWMAEVLRRIERMEKKRLKQRLSSVTLKNNQNIECAESDSNQFSRKYFKSEAISDNTYIKSGDVSIQMHLSTMDIEGSSEITSKTIGSTKDIESVITDEGQLNNQGSANIFEKLDMLDRESNHPFPTVSQDIKLNENVSPSKACDKAIVSEEGDARFRRRRSKQFTRSKFKYQGRCSVSHKQRRRRSQAALLCDSLSTVGQGGSREDRWLQMQLRRIAELNDNEVSQLTSLDMEKTLSDKNHIPLCTPSKEGSNMRVTLFEALGVKNELSKSDCNSNSCLQHLSPSLSRFSITSGCGKAVVADVNQSCNQISGNQHILDSEADCGFIVYRTREKDPMAKFSRTRSLDMNSLFATIHDEISEKNVSDIRQDVYTSADDISTSCLSQPFVHQTPRPTKKRWLSRALMEEDVESSNNNFSNSSQSINHSLSTKSDSSFILPNSCATPVNPKKRIISRLSEISEDLPVRIHFETGDNPKKEDSKILPDRLANNLNDEQVICNHDSTLNLQSHEDNGFCDPLSTHLAPLPPKKATVKQQAEELRLQEIRKVRVSLSEYRRRRGLPAYTPAPERNHKETKEPADHTNDNIDNLEIIIPPTLLSPDQLLITLPTHNESKPSSCVKNPDSLLQKITSFNIKPEVFHDCNESLAPYRQTPKICEFDSKHDFIDTKVNERGPRTPSEPPDDDDDDIGVDSINLVSRGALSSSPEPYIKFSGKVLSTHSSPASVFSDSRMASEKLHFRNSSPPDVNSSKYHNSCFPSNIFGSPVQIINENHLHDTNRTEKFDQDLINSEIIDHGHASIPELISTKQTHFDEILHHYRKTFDFDDSEHLHASVTSTGILPPPPPPPISSFSGHPTSSNSPVVPPYDIEKNLEDNSSHLPGSLEYFIQRDNEIRVWQETRSYEREKHNTSSWHHRLSGQPCLNTRKASYTVSKHPSKCSKNNESYSYYPDVVTGHFDNVEQTLLRIRDSLLAQLDLTKVGCSNSDNDGSSTKKNGAVC